MRVISVTGYNNTSNLDSLNNCKKSKNNFVTNDSQVSFGGLNILGKINSAIINRGWFNSFEDAVKYLKKKEMGACIEQAGGEYLKITPEKYRELQKGHTSSVIFKLPKSSSSMTSFPRDGSKPVTEKFSIREGISPRYVLDFLKKGIREASFLMDDGIQKLQLPSLSAKELKIMKKAVKNSVEYRLDYEGEFCMIMPDARPDALFEFTETMLNSLPVKGSKLEKIPY